MPIDSFLLDGEKILARAGIFYATDKRLIRYHKSFFSEELDDIPYSRITSIGVTKKPRRVFIKAGIIISLIAVITFFSIVVINSVLKSISGLLASFMGFDLTSILKPLIPFSLIMFLMGIAMLVLGFFPLQAFVQFRAPGLDKDTEAKFRMGGMRKEINKNLLRIVRQQSLGIPTSEMIASVQPQEDRGTQAPGQ